MASNKINPASTVKKWQKYSVLVVLLLGLFLSTFLVLRDKTTDISTDAACTKCTSGYSCKGNILYRCVNKCLSVVKNCNVDGDKLTCSASKRTCENRCPDGDWRCREKDNGMEYGQVCQNDRWNTVANCAYNEECVGCYNDDWPCCE